MRMEIPPPEEVGRIEMTPITPVTSLLEGEPAESTPFIALPGIHPIQASAPGQDRPPPSYFRTGAYNTPPRLNLARTQENYPTAPASSKAVPTQQVYPPLGP